jgi:P27 family predicted phage terminase small subunit
MARPVPTQLRLLHGAQPSKVNRNEPIPRDGKIEPPEWMSDRAREHFAFYVDELTHMRYGAPVDAHTLAIYCDALDEYERLTHVLAKSGMLVKRANGDVVRNPVLIARRDAAERIMRGAREFGFTPSARAGIDIGGLPFDDEDNPFAGA